MGEESVREQWHLLHSLPDFSHSLCYPQSNWALLVLLPRWVGLCVFWAPVGLSEELSCEAGSFSCCCLNLQEVFNQWFEALFPHAGTLGCAVYCQVPCQLQLCPPRSTICHLAGSTSRRLVVSPLRPPRPISAPPTSLDECFFFISWVVGLLCGLIFCQFWLFFVFKLSFFWLCEEAQCVDLRLHLGQKSKTPSWAASK